MSGIPKEFTEIDSCHCLFLREITEPRENALRLVLEEAFVLPEEGTVTVAGVEIKGSHPVRSVQGSRLFEIIWDSYVAYSVRNESYVTRDESETFSGRYACTYSKSQFLDYVSRSTFARTEYPGPLQHTGFVSEWHIVDVISSVHPRISRCDRTQPGSNSWNYLKCPVVLQQALH